MDQTMPHAALRSAAWIAIIVAASLGFSLAFACATPFVALAALAGTRMRAGEAFLAMLLAWLGNQAVGFLVLAYPQTATTSAWGGAIGLAAMLAVGLSLAAASLRVSAISRVALAFAAGFIGYEALLYATAFLMGSGYGAFTPAIVARIFAVNAVALAGLLALHRVAIGLGLLAPPARPRLAAAA